MSDLFRLGEQMAALLASQEEQLQALEKLREELQRQYDLANSVTNVLCRQMVRDLADQISRQFEEGA